MDVLVNLGQIFPLFFGTFIVDFEYYFLLRMLPYDISLSKPKRGYLCMGVIAKHYFPTVPMISPIGCSSEIFVYKLL